MSYYPFFIDIKDRTFLVIGGGRIAAEKIGRLKLFTDSIVVVAEETEINGVRVIRKKYDRRDLSLGDYVVAATGDPEVDRAVSDDCRAEGKPVNVVDDQALSDFIFPSVIKRGDLILAISSGGKSPACVKRLRREIEAVLPENMEEILDAMGEARKLVRAKVSDSPERNRIYGEMLDSLFETGEDPGEAVKKILEKYGS